MNHTIVISDEGYRGLNPVQFGYEDCQSGHYYGPAIRAVYSHIHCALVGNRLAWQPNISLFSMILWDSCGKVLKIIFYLLPGLDRRFFCAIV